MDSLIEAGASSAHRPVPSGAPRSAERRVDPRTGEVTIDLLAAGPATPSRTAPFRTAPLPTAPLPLGPSPLGPLLPASSWTVASPAVSSPVVSSPVGAGLLGGARIVGPGRLERFYRACIEELSAKLELADLIGRGSARRLERLDASLSALAHERARLVSEAAEQAAIERRLLVLLGALQRENAELRARLEPLPASPRRALAGAGPARRPLLSRLLRRPI